jgi:hypothetical protein
VAESYNASIPIELADRLYFSSPTALGRIMSGLVLREKAAQEPERFDALERAGFLLDRDGDMIYQIFQRFGGHYMDVGASQKISSGLVSRLKVASRHHSHNALLIELYPLDQNEIGLPPCILDGEWAFVQRWESSKS